MKVLFLDAYFEPEQIAFTHLENDLLQGLVDAGHEVEIVCPTPTRGIDKETAQKYKHIKSESIYNGHAHVTRFLAPQEGKNPLIRALRYFWCNLRTYQIGMKGKNVDLVFANSTPPTQGWIAGKVAKKLDVPFIYSLQDIFPDSLVNAGMTKEGSLIWKIGKKIEDKTYTGATEIITISEAFKMNLENKGVDTQKIKVIPNWIDTSEVFDVPREENKIIKKYHLDPTKFYICYSGNIGHSQNLELLIDVADELGQTNKQIEFVIIGEGAAKEKLEQMVQTKHLKNVHLLPFQPYEDIAHVFSLGDVGLIISKPGIGGSSVPSKTWSIMAAHRPVLASFDKNGVLDEAINSIDCGILVDSGNKELLISAIIRLFEDEKSRKHMADQGLNYVSSIISKENCVKKFVGYISNSKKTGASALSVDKFPS